MKDPTVYICIPVFNRVALTVECLKSIYNQQYRNFVIILCDDGSTDKTANIISSQFPLVNLLTGSGHLWWTGGMNCCIRLALKYARDEDFIYSLNNDTVLLTDTIEKLIAAAHNNPKTIIGTLNLFHDNPNCIENSGFIRKKGFTLYKRLNKWGEPLNNRSGLVPVHALSGKGMLIPAEAFRKTGLFNEEKLKHYHADFEFTVRCLRSGYKIFSSYDARLLSHQCDSGIGMVTSKPGFSDFVKSFTSLKSTHHITSVKNFHKLVYGKKYYPYYLLEMSGIIFGFLRRYTTYMIINDHHVKKS